MIGTQDKGTGTGETTMKALDFMFLQDGTSNSIFYGRIDKENVGITGFSQGGAAVMNVLTNEKYKSYFKTGVPLSPVSEKTTKEYTNYHYDSSKVEVPIMILAGTEGDFETQTVIPLTELNILFDKIKTNKLIARRKGMDHDQMMYSASGYVTAWFMWQLYGDEEAAKAFIGDTPEIVINPLYIDQKIDLVE